jgi:hypothetical protein
MTDEQLIAAGRKLVVKQEKSQLELGRLALAFAPIGDPSVKTGVYDRLELYADEIGMGLATLRQYRATAQAWQNIDVGEHGFTVLKALMAVADKEGLLAALAAEEPPTKSGRWTVEAAVEFAKEHGFWSHEGTGRDEVQTLVASIKRARKGLARVAEFELNDLERAALAQALTELALELASAREALKPASERRQYRPRVAS